MATSSQAVSLVVMATNSSPGIAGGYKAYDIGVVITAADVALGGANPVLFTQNLTFTGSANGPFEAAGTNNKQDLQSVWGTLDTVDGGGGGPSFPATGAAATQLFKDSWWYSSGTGNLQGTVDGSGNQGVVTTVPAGDATGVYAQGPGALVGTTGYLWTPQATGITGGATSNSTMGFTGLFGPLGADFLNPSPGGPFTDPNHILGDLLVQNGGTLTVPLAQIIVKGNLSIPSPGGGAGTFLEVGTPIYNVLGGPQSIDPGAILDFTTNTIHPGVPEPGTFALLGMGMIGLLLAWKRRK
jgi:hypothetical protein